MKSYTDFNQSKKLAEILPLETADMCYPLPCEDGDKPLLEQGGFGSTPCWSLVALLDILPSATLDSSDDHHYRLHCNEKFTEWHDNPIDCCVAMIDRLHEQMIYDFNNS